MPEVASDEDPLDAVAEEFVARLRAGEQPRIAEFCDRDPARADEIRDFLSAVQALEVARTPEAPVTSHPLAAQIGDYRLLREIGRGGMGIVYEAEQVSLGRRVALKVLPTWATRSPSQIQRFYREARAAAGLHHTNIVPVFGVGEDGGVHYYVMPLIEGRGLDQVLAELRRGPRHLEQSVADTDRIAAADTNSEVGPVPLGSGSKSLSHPGQRFWRQAAQIAMHAAEALDYAASQGVLHRDIKPSNLLLDAHGTVWITDFGLAKAAGSEDLTVTGDVLGTLRYLAPERLRGVSDLRGDIYGLGMTLYELLTLRPAFSAQDRPRLTQQIVAEEPAAPRAVDPHIPRDLETIVLKAIAKQPSDRYQSAAAMADDLRLFLADRPILSRRIGPAERLLRWCRRNPLLASLEVAVILLGVVAVIILAVANARIGREVAEKSTALQAERAAQHEKDNALELARASEQLAQRRFYATQMSLAEVAIRENEWGRALDALNNQLPAAGGKDLRGFEWHYLHRQLHRGLHRSFRQEPGEIFSLAFSPDGQTLAVCSGHDLRGGSVQLWSVARGEHLRALNSGKFVPHCVDFSQDGKKIVAGFSNRRLLVWDALTGDQVRALQPPSMVRSVGWSPDGQLIAAGCENGAVVTWDTTDWQPRGKLQPHGGPVISLTFTPDGKRFYTSAAWGRENRMARAHDSSRQAPETIGQYPGRFISDVSSDGSQLISHQWSTISLIDRDTRAVSDSHTVGAGSISTLRLSPDGRRYATAGRDDRMAILWDRENKTRLVQGAHSSPVLSVAFDPDGRYWATGAADGEVKIWHYELPHEVLEWNHNPLVEHLVSDGDNTLVISGDFLAEGFDLRTCERVSLPPAKHVRRISANGQVLVTAFKPDGSATEQIQIWDRTGGKLRYEFRLPDKREIQSSDLAISRSGRWLATRTWDGPVRLWELTPQEPRAVGELNPSDCMELVFSPDEQYLAAACQFGRVRLWSVETRAALPEVWGYESSNIWCHRVAFSGDGNRLAAATDTGVVRVFEMNPQRLLATLTGHNGQTSALQWFPDGKTLAVAGVGPIRLWDVEIGQECLALPVNDYRTSQLALSATVQTLFSRSYHGVVRIFHAGEAPAANFFK